VDEQRLRSMEGFLGSLVDPYCPETRDAGKEEEKPLFAPPVPDIPRYEIRGELGRGGMGVVYKAWDFELEREVALKTIRTDRASPDDLTRFKRDAQSAARLSHPNIVQIYDIGEHQGVPYFSLEFVAGGSLHQRLRASPHLPPPDDSAALVRTVALAMHAAHGQGIIHRDLKPANILLATDPASGGRPPPVEGQTGGLRPLTDYTPKVSDFGLAKQLDDPSEHTLSGVVMGTAAYMPPEQAEGRLKDIGPETDGYALGAILYECLTGRPPFVAGSLWETIQQVIDAAPVPVRRLAPDCPRDLETICLKCLHKAKGRRYSSALDLAEDLGRYLDRKPILARPVSVWERAAKWARRRPAVAGLVATALLAVLAVAVGGLFYGLYQEQQATTARQRLERSRLAHEGEAQGNAAETAGNHLQAKQHYDEALAILDADPDSADMGLRRRLVEGRERVRRNLKEEEDRRKREALLAAQRADFQKRGKLFGQHLDQVLLHAVSLRAQSAANDAEVVRREAPAALGQLRLSVDAPESFGAGLHRYRPLVETPEQLDRLSAECYQMLLVWAEVEAATAPKQAKQLLDAAFALGKAHGHITPQVFHLQCARVLGLLGDPAGARGAVELAAAVAPNSALDHFHAALDSYRKGRFEQAVTSCEEVLSKDSSHFWARYLKVLCNMRAKRWDLAKDGLTECLVRRPNHPSLLFLLGNTHGALGALAAEKKDDAAARKAYADSLARFAQAWDGDDRPAFRADVLTGRSAVHLYQGRWDDARRDLLLAVQLQPNAYQRYANLAQAYKGRGDRDEAVKALDQAIALRPGPALPALYDTRARLQVERGDLAAAQRDFEEVIAREPRGSTSERRAGAWVNLAQLKHQARDYDAALADCAAALAARPDYAPAHGQRARTLLALGKYDEAAGALDRYLARRSGAAVPRRGDRQCGRSAPAEVAPGRRASPGRAGACRRTAPRRAAAGRIRRRSRRLRRATPAGACPRLETRAVALRRP
jgi:tetratricopeptide (TPR) repeat protein